MSADRVLRSALRPPMTLRRRTHWPQPDFVVRPQRAPAIAWVLLAAGVLACAAATHEWIGLRLAEADATQQADRMQSRARIAAAPRAAIKADSGALQSAHLLNERLGHRWQALFAALEAVEQPVFWLRLQADAGGGQVVLEGTTPTRAALQQALMELARAPHWQSVTLNGIDLQPGPSTDEPKPMRFALNARCCTRSRATETLP